MTYNSEEGKQTLVREQNAFIENSLALLTEQECNQHKILAFQIEPLEGIGTHTFSLSILVRDESQPTSSQLNCYEFVTGNKNNEVMIFFTDRITEDYCTELLEQMADINGRPLQINLGFDDPVYTNLLRNVKYEYILRMKKALAALLLLDHFESIAFAHQERITQIINALNLEKDTNNA